MTTMILTPQTHTLQIHATSGAGQQQRANSKTHSYAGQLAAVAIVAVADLLLMLVSVSL